MASARALWFLWRAPRCGLRTALPERPAGARTQSKSAVEKSRRASRPPQGRAGAPPRRRAPAVALYAVFRRRLKYYFVSANFLLAKTRGERRELPVRSEKNCIQRDTPSEKAAPGPAPSRRRGAPGLWAASPGGGAGLPRRMPGRRNPSARADRCRIRAFRADRCLIIETCAFSCRNPAVCVFSPRS